MMEFNIHKVMLFAALAINSIPVADARGQDVEVLGVAIRRAVDQTLLPNLPVFVIDNDGNDRTEKLLGDKAALGDDGKCPISLNELSGGFLIVDTLTSKTARGELIIPSPVRLGNAGDDFSTHVTALARSLDSFTATDEAIHELELVESILKGAVEKRDSKRPTSNKLRAFQSKVKQTLAQLAAQPKKLPPQRSPKDDQHGDATTEEVHIIPFSTTGLKLIGNEPSSNSAGSSAQTLVGARWFVLDSFGRYVATANGTIAPDDEMLFADLVPGHVYSLMIVRDRQKRMPNGAYLPPESVRFCPSRADPKDQSLPVTFDKEVAMYCPSYGASPKQYRQYLATLRDRTQLLAKIAKESGDDNSPALEVHEQAIELLGMPVAPINDPSKIESLSTLFGPVPTPDWERVLMTSLKHPNTNFWVVAKTNEFGMEAGWQIPYSRFLEAQFTRNNNGSRSNFRVVGYVSLYGPKADLAIWSELGNVNGKNGTLVSGVLFDNFGSFPVARRKDLYEKLKNLYGPDYTIFGTFSSPFNTAEFGEKPYCDVMILQKGERFEKDGVVALQNSGLPLSKLGVINIGVKADGYVDTLRSLADTHVSFICLSDFTTTNKEFRWFDKTVPLPLYWEELCDKIDEHNK